MFGVAFVVTDVELVIVHCTHPNKKPFGVSLTLSRVGGPDGAGRDTPKGYRKFPAKGCRYFISSCDSLQTFPERCSVKPIKHWPPLVSNPIHTPHLHSRARRYAKSLGQPGVASSFLVGVLIEPLEIRVVFCHGRDYNINL